MESENERLILEALAWLVLCQLDERKNGTWPGLASGELLHRALISALETKP